jgi:acetaldehyde/propanal dehydrogenase
MKTKCVIIGSGNIGTDLLYKLRRSTIVEPAWMIGIEPVSAGLARAKALGLSTTHAGLAAVIDDFAADGVRIAFDVTSASEHAKNAALLERAGILSIDLTPAALGPYCVPSVDLTSQAAVSTKRISARGLRRRLRPHPTRSFSGRRTTPSTTPRARRAPARKSLAGSSI